MPTNEPARLPASTEPPVTAPSLSDLLRSMSDSMETMRRTMFADLFNPPATGTVTWEPRHPPKATPEPAYKTETVTIRTVYIPRDEPAPPDQGGEFDPRIGRVVIEGKVQDGRPDE